MGLFQDSDRFFKDSNIHINPYTPKSDLIDFTLSNPRRFYSSKGDPLGVKGLKKLIRSEKKKVKPPGMHWSKDF